VTQGKRFLSAYDARRLLGHIEIKQRERRRPRIAASDVNGRSLGTFKSQRAALTAIDNSVEAAR
jgi:hypothetical protein